MQCSSDLCRCRYNAQCRACVGPVGREAAVTLLTDTLAVEIACLDAHAVFKDSNGYTCQSALENGVETGAEV